jgi:hypothetical protein
VVLHIKSDAGGELPTEVLNHVGKFTEYFCCLWETHYRLTLGIRILHKIHVFVEAQKKGNKVKNFFRQGEMNALLKECQVGLQQSFDFFKVRCQFHVAMIH